VRPLAQVLELDTNEIVTALVAGQLLAAAIVADTHDTAEDSVNVAQEIVAEVLRRRPA
jgi:hypothetical protein